jgi:hypothetical protein
MPVLMQDDGNHFAVIVLEEFDLRRNHGWKELGLGFGVKRNSSLAGVRFVPGMCLAPASPADRMGNGLWSAKVMQAVKFRKSVATRGDRSNCSNKDGAP